MTYKKPIPKSVTDNPLHGATINKIVLLGLSEKADELRAAGCSLSEITQTLNEKYLTDSDYKVSVMSVQRYFDRWSKLEKTDNRKTEENVNVYNEYKMLYEITLDSLEAVHANIMELKKNKAENAKEIRENSFLAEKLTARCQNILQSMADIMAKIYNYMNYQKVIEMIFEIINEECGVETKGKIINRIRQNPELSILMKKIEDMKD